MSEHATFLASVAAVYFLLAASPGPNFILITHAAASHARRTGFFICLGVSSASAFWAALAAAGLGVVVQRMEEAYRFLQVAGGVYLLYLAWTMLRRQATHAAPEARIEAPPGAAQAYRLGLLTNLGNPKSLAFFGSAFASLFTHDQPAWLLVAAVAVVGAISISWNVLVLLVFSTPHLRSGYRRIKHHVDRVAGALLGAFGLRMILGR